MKRPGAPLTLDLLLEEVKFILRTLQRGDLFGERVSLTEAERVLDNSISLNFGEYCGFLEQVGYVSTDSTANIVEVTPSGDQLARGVDTSGLHAQIAKHFARELEQAAVPSRPPEPVPPPAMRGRPGERDASGIEDILDRRYRKEGTVGEGPLATVFRGRHVGLGRAVAIKEARALFSVASYLRRDEAVLRWRDRIEAMASLQHPFILPVFDHNADREHPYVVSELCARSVRGLMSESIPTAVAGRIVVQTAAALVHAHGRGRLHLGLKPENLLLDAFGNVRLSDFGMATVTERPADAAQGSIPPVMVGGDVVPYLAPERLDPSSEASEASDVYGLGMILYELLVGKLPGRRSKMPSELRSDVPAEVDDVFDRMTRDDLSERHPRMADAMKEVQSAFGLDAELVHTSVTA